MNPSGQPTPSSREDAPQIFALKSRAGQWSATRRNVLHMAAAGGALGTLTGCGESSELKQLRAKNAHGSSISNLAVGGAEAELFSCDEKGYVKVWSLKDGTLLRRPLRTGTDSLQWLLAREAEVIAIGTSGATGKGVIYSVIGSQSGLLHPDATFVRPIAAACNDQPDVLALLEPESHHYGRLRWLRYPAGFPQSLINLSDAYGACLTLAFGTYRGDPVLALGGFRAREHWNTVRLLSLRDGGEVQTLRTVTASQPSRIVFSTEDERLVVCDNGGAVEVLPLDGTPPSLGIQVKVTGQPSAMHAFAANRGHFALANEGQVVLGELSSGKILRTFDAGRTYKATRRINAMTFCEFRGTPCLATADSGGKIRLWDIGTGDLMAGLEEPGLTPTPEPTPPSSSSRSGGGTYRSGGSHYWRPN